MKTDTFFYRLLQTYPELVFELSNTPVLPGYRWSAVEVKEQSFRFDGVLVPPATEPAAPIWFVEVQFQRRETFYWDFFTEVAIYLRQFRVERPCRLLALFPNRDVDVVVPPFYQLQVSAGWLCRVYLNEWTGEASWGGELLKLVVAPETEVAAKVQALCTQAQTMGAVLQREVLDWLETLLVYRYPKRSREEIARMFALGDLRETRVYQEALSEGIQLGKQEGIQLGKQEGIQLGKQEGIQLGKQEGIQLGKQEGEAQLVIRLLTRRLGSITTAQQQQIAALPVVKLEALAEALLDWQTPGELVHWLATHS